MSKRRFRVNITKQLPFHLHNVPDWIEGEYVWSYVGRLAESNGFNDITVFLNRIFALKSETEWKRFMKWGYDIDRPCIQDLFEIEGRDHWIVEMTLFPVLLPFFSRGYQDNKIRAYTEDYERDASRMINRPHSDVKKLRICPKCMKSDIEDGFFYYHLLHQMPGLSTCPLHGCPLMEYSGEIGREANTWSFVPVENSHTAPGYADICLGMTEYPADISAQDTISAIIKQLEKRYGTTQKKELASSVKSDISFSSYQAESKLIRYMLRSTNQNELPAETAINCISLLFESWEDFLDMLPESRSYEEAFKKAIAGEFSMLGHYRNSFVNVKCDFCGHIFPATPLSLIMEAGCPVCNQQLSNKEIFERMFNAASQGEWEYEGDFISMGKPIIFIDKKNNHESYRMTPQTFIYQESSALQSLSSPNLCKTRRHTINLKETQRGIKYRKEIEASENSGQHVIYLTTTGIAVMECNSCGSHHIVDFNICSSPICSSCSSVNPLPYGEFIYLQCAGTFSAISEDFSVEADSRRRLCSLITEHMSEKSNYSTLHREIDSIISSMKGQLLFTEDLELGELQKPATQYLQGLFKKGVLERFDTGIYFLAGERHSEEEILSAKFFRRKRKYVGVPSHMTLIEWIKTGSFSCKEAVFTVTRHTNSTERMAWRKTGSMRTKIFFTELVIQESDWKMIAAIMTLRHMDWVDSLQSRDRSELRSWCKTAITEQEIDNFWQKHKTFSKKRVLSFLKEGQNGKAHK